MILTSHKFSSDPIQMNSTLYEVAVVFLFFAPSTKVCITVTVGLIRALGSAESGYRDESTEGGEILPGGRNHQTCNCYSQPQSFRSARHAEHLSVARVSWTDSRATLIHTPLSFTASLLAMAPSSDHCRELASPNKWNFGLSLSVLLCCLADHPHPNSSSQTMQADGAPVSSSSAS